MNELEVHINNLLGDAFLSSAFLAYIGFYDSFYRKYLRDKSRQILRQNEICFRNDLDEVKWLTKANDRIKWQNCKLPNDNICLENATILQRFNRYPLIIDPEGQVKEFIKAFYAKRRYTTSFTDTNFLKILENALRYGYTLLIIDVEKIEPIMDSILNKEIHKKYGRNLIRLGDQEIEVFGPFNMIMITRDSSFNFTPELCSRVTILNFTITPSFLQNKILEIILNHEEPDINKEKEYLVKAQIEFELQLKELEDDFLSDFIFSFEENVLDNNEFIIRLEDVKKNSNDISDEISKIEDNMRELDYAINEYFPLANKVSRIYFVLDALKSIHYLYRYSLSFFIDIFNYVINSKFVNAIPKTQYNERQQRIISLLFKEIYHRVGYSLLNNDRVILALKLAQISLNEKFKNEINLLLKISYSIMIKDFDTKLYILNGKLNLNQKNNLMN